MLTSLPRIALQTLVDLPLVLLNGQVDAVGESTAFIGQMWLSTGPGTSKVLSSSGGKIHFSAASVTFANAGTTLRIGVQDVDATTGIEDTTNDVNGDLTGGGGGITANTLCSVTMGTGTKTIAHGDIIAVVIEMTARGGADAVQVNRYATALVSNFPYCTNDTGAGPAKAATLPMCVVEFDDGTVGFFGPWTLPGVASITNFNSGSTPDEYALIFTAPVPMTIHGLAVTVGEIDAGETGEVILYSDPLGTPVAERTATPDPDIVALSGASVGLSVFSITAFSLVRGATYAIAYRPTSAGSRGIGFTTIPSANSRAAYPFGITAQGGSRTDQTGAFGSLSSTVLPHMGLVIGQYDNGFGTRARFVLGGVS